MVMTAIMMLVLTYMMTYQLEHISPDNRFHTSCGATFKNNDNSQHQYQLIMSQNITKFPTIQFRINFTCGGVEDADDEDGDTSQVQVDPGHLFDIILEYKYKHVYKSKCKYTR